MATHGERGGRESEVLERQWAWRSCDRCGSTVMLGEATLRLRVEGAPGWHRVGECPQARQLPGVVVYR